MNSTYNTFVLNELRTCFVFSHFCEVVQCLMVLRQLTDVPDTILAGRKMHNIRPHLGKWLLGAPVQKIWKKSQMQKFCPDWGDFARFDDFS